MIEGLGLTQVMVMKCFDHACDEFKFLPSFNV